MFRGPGSVLAARATMPIVERRCGHGHDFENRNWMAAPRFTLRDGATSGTLLLRSRMRRRTRLQKTGGVPNLYQSVASTPLRRPRETNLATPKMQTARSRSAPTLLKDSEALLGAVGAPAHNFESHQLFVGERKIRLKFDRHFIIVIGVFDVAHRLIHDAAVIIGDFKFVCFQRDATIDIRQRHIVILEHNLSGAAIDITLAQRSVETETGIVIRKRAFRIIRARTQDAAVDEGRRPVAV